MTAEVIPIRPFQSARDQAKRLGTNVTMSIGERRAAEGSGVTTTEAECAG